VLNHSGARLYIGQLARSLKPVSRARR
jgi:hypothetical protein